MTVATSRIGSMAYSSLESSLRFEERSPAEEVFERTETLIRYVFTAPSIQVRIYAA